MNANDTQPLRPLFCRWIAMTCAGLLTAQAAVKPSPAGGQSRSAGLRIGGSSTVFPILREAIKAYRDAGNQGPISLRETGSSDGFRRFCNGELEIANASRPINSKEISACKKNGVVFLELPIAFDALTIVVNPANTWAKSISLAQLARLWNRQAQGRIQRWNQVSTQWPERPISLCGPGRDSGTFDYFNKVIHGDATQSRLDYSASEDDTVTARCVAKQANALGYFGFSYYQENQKILRALPISTAAGSIAPSIANAQSGRYPLSRPLFLYINDQALAQRSDVQRFSSFTIRNGLRFVRQAGDIPLPASTYRLVESKLYKRITGTAFAGQIPVGLSLGEVLRRSFDERKLPQYR
jgi:phosphate transport system substrate-binding protein